MKLSELAQITSGLLLGADVEFSSASIDTRTLQAGDLFIAITGPRFDGHDFVTQAVQAGAIAALVEREVPVDVPQVIVADTRIALGLLGSAWRSSLPVKVVGLTGSNGKTTVKEMIASILGVKDAVLATKGNLNNDFGVPLTLLKIQPQHRYAVIEMGANHLKEIEYVATLAKPDLALVNNAGSSHLEGFGSREGVAQGKGEIFTALDANGVAVINADDAFADYWTGLAGSRRIVRFGFAEHADVRALPDSIQSGWADEGFVTRFICQHPQGQFAITLRLAGRHNVSNALAAAAACYGLGLDFAQIVEGLGRLQPVSGRIQPGRAANGALLINDTYNANPSSFSAALEVLLDLPGEPWVALGAFGELGPDSPELHRDLGSLARSKGVKRLYATGPNADQATQAFGSGALYFERQEDLIQQLKSELHRDVALLVKGSRSQRMEKVVEALHAKE